MVEATHDSQALRLLHVVPTQDPCYGGPIRVAQSMVKFLRARGHEVRFLPLAHSTRPFFWPGWAGWSELRESIRWAQLVHIHGLWTLPTTFSAAAARKLGRPYVMTPHGTLGRWGLRRSAIKKRIYAALWERRNLDQASGLHFLNRQEHDEALEFGIRAPSFMLPNGIDVSEFQDMPERRSFLQHYPELHGKVIALFLGRVHPKKGLDLLIPALKKAVANVSELRLVIAGPDEGGYRAVVEDKIKAERLDAYVRMIGPVFGQDKREVLGGADFFVLTSYEEGDSIAIKEAMAAGLPVLASEEARFREMAQAGAGVVASLNVDEIAAGLIALTTDASLRRSMSERGRAIVDAEYRWESIVERLLQVYRDALSVTARDAQLARAASNK